MYIVLLKFSGNRDNAEQFMASHNAWIKRGFDDGVFILVGSLQPKKGGAVLARGIDREELESRVNNDPFVAEKIVDAEILEITPAKAEERLAFLVG